MHGCQGQQERGWGAGGGPCPSGALRRRGAAGPGAHPHPGQGGFRQLPALKSPCHHPHRAALASRTKASGPRRPQHPSRSRIILQRPCLSTSPLAFPSVFFVGFVWFFVFCSVFESRPPPPYFLLCLSGCLSGPPVPPLSPSGPPWVQCVPCPFVLLHPRPGPALSSAHMSPRTPRGGRLCFSLA